MGKIQLDVIVKQEGCRTDGFINIAQKADYTWFQIPVILLEGNRPGPTLLLEAGTHGDEQEGTAAILATVKRLADGDFAGTIVGIPALNTEAFSQIARASITDGNNLNRVYPGNTTSYITPRIAAEYGERIVAHVDYAICFHGGGQVLHLEPIVAFKPGDSEMAKKSQGMAKAFNFKYQWRPEDIPFGGTVVEIMEKYGVPFCGPECGSQCGRLYDWEKNVQLDADGIRNVMAYLEMTPPVAYEETEKIYVKLMYLHSHHGGLHNIAKKQNEFVKEGEVLTYITDFFGNVIEEIKAPCDGIVNGFWSVPAIRPGDWSSLFMALV